MEKQDKILYAIAMGGNIGQILSTFKEAISKVSVRLGVVLKVSKIYQSKPLPTQDGEKQDPYLNGVFILESLLSPRELLVELIKIEEELGRDRKLSAHWGPRTIDLDIIVAGDLIVDEDDLKVPHPRMLERDFVLVPLYDVLPEWKDNSEGMCLRNLIDNLHPKHIFISRVFLDKL